MVEASGPAPFGDIPASLSIGTSQSVRRNAGGTAFEAYTPSAGVTTFIGLSDVPNSYSGQGLKGVRVNVAASGLEFYTISGGTPGGSDKQLQYNNANTFGGIPSLTYDGTIPATVTLSTLGDTATGLLLQDVTPATNANFYHSPSLQFTAQTWNTTAGASQPVDFRIHNEPASYTGANATWDFDYRQNGGAWLRGFWWDTNLPGLVLSNGNKFSTDNIYDVSSDVYIKDPIISNNLADGVKVIGAINGMKFRPNNTNQLLGLQLIPNGSIANYPASLFLLSTDYVADLTNYSGLDIISKGTSDTYHSISSLKGGSGVLHPINIEAVNSVGATAQLVIGTDGGVSVGTGTQAGSTNLLVAGAVNSVGGYKVNGAATASTILKGNGTNYVASTETYAAPGTSGNVMTSDGTNWTSSAVSTNYRVGGFTAHFSRGGVAIQTNDTIITPWTCPYSGTITGYSISADTGTCTLKTWKKANGTAIPTIADVISTSGVSLATGTHIRSSTVSDFTTTTVTAGDMFMAQVTATSGPTDITFQVEITR